MQISKGEILAGCDSSKTTGKQIVHALAAVPKSSMQYRMCRAVKCFLTQDDCDQTKVQRIRIVTAHLPRIKVTNHITGIMQDYGHQIDDCKRATLECLRKACIMQNGRRDGLDFAGSLDELITEAYNRVCQTMKGCTTDGHAIEIEACTAGAL